jgi:hypothetical protein
MLLTLRQQLIKFAHLLQNELFPTLEAETGELTEAGKRLTAVLAMVPLRRFVPVAQGWNGRLRKIVMPSPARSSQKRYTTSRPRAISLSTCAVMSNYGVSAAGTAQTNYRMSPLSQGPSPSSPPWNYHSSCTRL